MLEAAAKTGNLSAAEHWFRRHTPRGALRVDGRQRRCYGIQVTSAQDFDQLIQAAAMARDLEAAERWFQDPGSRSGSCFGLAVPQKRLKTSLTRLKWRHVG